MGGLAPGEKTLNMVLKDEDHSYPVQPSATFIRNPVEASYLALKRRKLLVINGSEKLGRPMNFELLTFDGRSNS